METNQIWISNLDDMSVLGLHKCSELGCNNPAVETLPLCWHHLSQDEKARFRVHLSSNKKSLKGAKLPLVDLSHLDLSEGDLRSAVLIGCNLSNCICHRTGLLGANLTHAYGTNADFRRARLNYANFSLAAFYESIFEGAVLASSSAVSAKFLNCNFNEAMAYGTAFTQCDMTGSSFARCKLEGANFRESNLTNCNFEAADLQFSQLSLSDLSGANISNSKIFGASAWGIETERLTQNNVITGYKNKRGLPAFIAFGSSPTVQYTPYIFRLTIHGKKATARNIALKLSVLDEVFSDSAIWGNMPRPVLTVSSIESGSVDIKLIVDYAKEYLPQLNTSILVMALLFIGGIELVAVGADKVLDIYIKYAEHKQKIVASGLNNQKTKLELIQTELAIQERADLIAKKSKQVVADVRKKRVPLSVRTQKEVDKALCEIAKTQSIRHPSQSDIFDGIKLIEGVMPTADENKAYVIRIDSKRDITATLIEKSAN